MRRTRARTLTFARQAARLTLHGNVYQARERA